MATAIYDATVLFCDRFIDKRSRTHDQMVQAARSGRQNITEGSRAAAVSSQTEIRLISVARASLEELLMGYEDYLRQRGKRTWEKEDREAREVRALRWDDGQTEPADRTDPVRHWKIYSRWLEHKDSAIVANTLLCLIHQANYLLDQQITALEQKFVREGGYSEQLAAARIAERGKGERPAQANQPAPN